MLGLKRKIYAATMQFCPDLHSPMTAIVFKHMALALTKSGGSVAPAVVFTEIAKLSPGSIGDDVKLVVEALIIPPPTTSTVRLYRGSDPVSYVRVTLTRAEPTWYLADLIAKEDGAHLVVLSAMVSTFEVWVLLSPVSQTPIMPATEMVKAIRSIVAIRGLTPLDLCLIKDYWVCLFKYHFR